MIKNDVFDNKSLVSLVNITFHWLEELGSPARDEETEQSKQNVFNASSDKIVSTFKILNNNK
jgi:hypothetical protein